MGTEDQIELPAQVRVEELGSASQHNPLMHAHEGLELVRVEQGNMDLVVDDAPHRLEEGETCLINSGRMHQARKVEGRSCAYRVMHLDPSKLTRDEEIYERYIAPVLKDPSFDLMLGKNCEGTAGEVCKIMDEIFELEQTKPPAYELEVIALAHLVFKQIYLRRHALVGQKASHMADSPQRTQRQMTAYIYEHYGEHVSLDDIANAGGVSKSKASVIFRDQLDSSPVEFLNKYRLEVAEYMLTNTEDTVARIASACGFSQQSYFNRVFLREFGMTPKQYRHEQKKTTSLTTRAGVAK